MICLGSFIIHKKIAGSLNGDNKLKNITNESKIQERTEKFITKTIGQNHKNNDPILKP